MLTKEKFIVILIMILKSMVFGGLASQGLPLFITNALYYKNLVYLLLCLRFLRIECHQHAQSQLSYLVLKFMKCCACAHSQHKIPVPVSLLLTQNIFNTLFLVFLLLTLNMQLSAGLMQPVYVILARNFQICIGSICIRNRTDICNAMDMCNPA